jgi:hypothetical protein
MGPRGSALGARPLGLGAPEPFQSAIVARPAGGEPERFRGNCCAGHRMSPVLCYRCSIADDVATKRPQGSEAQSTRTCRGKFHVIMSNLRVLRNCAERPGAPTKGCCSGLPLCGWPESSTSQLCRKCAVKLNVDMRERENHEKIMMEGAYKLTAVNCRNSPDVHRLRR